MLKQAFKRLHRHLKLRKLFNLARYTQTFLRHDVGAWPEAVRVADFAGLYRRVLMLAPHQDDEAFSLGGTLWTLARQGATVDCVWFSRGADPVRVPEARAMMSLLNAATRGIESFPIPDESVPVRRSREVIAALLREHRPDLVCVPSIFDSHIDHMRLNVALSQALEDTGVDTTVLQYEVWNSLVPNLVIDISGVVADKRRLMEVYHSQLNEPERRYIERTLCLNRYRGMEPMVDYAEGVLLSSSQTFIGYRTGLPAASVNPS